MTKRVTWRCAVFAELSAEELYRILALREQVFVVEQGCAYLDADGKDPHAVHVLGHCDDKLVAYARLFAPGAVAHNASIGRVAVAAEYRKNKFGQEVMRRALDYFKQTSAVSTPTRVEISAQTYLLRFYNALGFSEYGEEYLEDGIPHIRMSASV